MIVGLFPALTSIGGVQLAGRQTAAALSVIARDHDWPASFLTISDPMGEQEASVGEIQFRFTGFARNKLRFSVKALSLAREKPKVIFAGHPNLAPVVALMKTVSSGARTIVATHGIEIWRPLPMIRRTALRRADAVTAPSSHTVQKLASVQNVSTTRIRRLPWPLDPDFQELAKRPEQPSPPAEFPLGQTVLSVGRWAARERYKGSDLLIQAVADLSQEVPEIQLVLAGPGDDLPRLRHIAETAGVRRRVHFLTELSRRELAGCYAAADVFALPSTGEGFGLAFLEAMAFGKPVIGTRMGGIPDVVEHQREGLLVDASVGALSHALKQLLSNNSCRTEMGERAKERVEREFTFARFQEALLDVTSCES